MMKFRARDTLDRVDVHVRETRHSEQGRLNLEAVIKGFCKKRRVLLQQLEHGRDAEPQEGVVGTQHRNVAKKNMVYFDRARAKRERDARMVILDLQPQTEIWRRTQAGESHPMESDEESLFGNDKSEGGASGQ
jgi:hypothetical protein